MSMVKRVVDTGVRDLTKMFKSPAKSEIRSFAIELMEAVKEDLDGTNDCCDCPGTGNLKLVDSLIKEIK